jgi:hypothetical protein
MNEYLYKEQLKNYKFELLINTKELLTEYSDLFTEFDFFTVGTVDGTLNYVFSLLVDLEEYESRNIQKK